MGPCCHYTHTQITAKIKIKNVCHVADLQLLKLTDLTDNSNYPSCMFPGNINSGLFAQKLV